MPRVPRPLNAELYRGLRKKRCEGQLKRFSSCQDIRAWSLNKYERQCHMRDILATSCDSSENGSDEDINNHKLPLSTLLSALFVSKKLAEDKLKEEIRELNCNLEKCRQGSQPVNSQTVSASNDGNLIKESNQNQPQKQPTKDNASPDSKKESLTKKITSQPSEKTDKHISEEESSKELPQSQTAETEPPEPTQAVPPEKSSPEFDNSENVSEFPPSETPISDALISDKASIDKPTLETASSNKSSSEEQLIEGIVQEKSQPEELLEAAPILKDIPQENSLPKEPIPEKPSTDKIPDDKDDIPKEPSPDEIPDDKDDVISGQENYENESENEVESVVYEHLSSKTAIGENSCIIFLTEFTAESSTVINKRFTDLTPSDEQIPYEIPLQMDLDKNSQYEKSNSENTDSESVNKCSSCGEEKNIDDVINFILSRSTPRYKNVPIYEQPHHSHYPYSPPRPVPRRYEELQREQYYQNPIHVTRSPSRGTTNSQCTHINYDYFNPRHQFRNNSPDEKEYPQRYVGSREPTANVNTRPINSMNRHPYTYKGVKVIAQEFIPPHPQYRSPCNQTQYQVRRNIPVHSNYQLCETRHSYPHAPVRVECNCWQQRATPEFNPQVHNPKQLHRNYYDSYSQPLRYCDYYQHLHS